MVFKGHKFVCKVFVWTFLTSATVTLLFPLFPTVRNHLAEFHNGHMDINASQALEVNVMWCLRLRKVCKAVQQSLETGGQNEMHAPSKRCNGKADICWGRGFLASQRCVNGPFHGGSGVVCILPPCWEEVGRNARATGITGVNLSLSRCSRVRTRLS